MPDQVEVLLAERWLGADLGALRDDEVTPVYVCVILNSEAVRRHVVAEEDMRLVSWAEVARNPSLLS